MSNNEYAFVQCVRCDNNDRYGGRLSVDTEQMSDKELRIIFILRGWTVGPTVCPECHSRKELS